MIGKPEQSEGTIVHNRVQGKNDLIGSKMIAKSPEIDIRLLHDVNQSRKQVQVGS